jgi:hypothetical protein
MTDATSHPGIFLSFWTSKIDSDAQIKKYRSYLGLLSPYNTNPKRYDYVFVYDFEKGEPYIRAYT